jgi:hypothetical protein
MTGHALSRGNAMRPVQQRRLTDHERKNRQESKMSGGLLPDRDLGGQEQSGR